jgi:pilin isopeptide linkage protein
MKKLMACAVALVMVLTTVFAGMTTAYAADAAVELQTAKSGDNVTVSLVAKSDFNVGGLEGTFSYDANAFTSAGEVTSDLLEVNENASTGKIMLDTGSNLDIKAGDVLAVWTFTTADAFAKDTDYTFTFQLEDAYNFDLDSYDWAEETLTVTYNEPDEVEPTEPNKVVDLSDITITKVIEGEGYETTTFTFTVTAVTDGAPAIEDLTIASDGTSLSVSLPSEVEFPNGGVFEYTVAEVQDATDEAWTYDDATFTLKLEIEPYNENGDLKLDAVVVSDASGEKVDAIEFTNKYEPTAFTTLTVKKVVEGEGDNPLYADKEFSFTITFVAPEGVTEDITVGNDTITAPYETYEFTLKNGDELTFENIPVGTTYTLVESGEEYYTGAAEVVSGETKSSVEGEYAADLTVNGTAADGENGVTVTNTYSITPPTGVTIHSEMIVVMALVMVALLGSFVLSRKLRRTR